MIAATEPTRAAIDALEGLTLLEFGTSWCGYCQAAQPDITTVVSAHPEIRHLKIEDGKGRPLGRSFRVTLWPTLVLLEAGVEKGRVVRPDSAQAIEKMLTAP